jgi:putative transposase
MTLSFKWRQFEKEIILMLVRWYCAYSLSYRDIEELANERGLSVDHSTVNRWVIRYAPPLEEQFRKSYKREVNDSWRMDETYLKMKGKDVYLYRAVDKLGHTIDFMLSEKRDKKAAFQFFCKAIGQQGLPEKVTMDKSGANKAGIDKINLLLTLVFLFTGIFYQIMVRQIKYLNNIVEQDHRHIKKITRPMKGFKSFTSAKATIAGIELHHMLKKEQHKSAANLPVYKQFYVLAA